jgi:L-2-hydroxyglutarate oxidase
VTGIFEDSQGVLVEHEKGTAKADFLINAAGLHSDKVANLAGLKTTAKIFPFKGEYFELDKESSGLVNGLIYPTPNPDMPFLGVHLTKMISGSVHAGPNAIMALSREGYRRNSVDVRTAIELLRSSGFYGFFAKNRGFALQELYRSLSKKKYAQDLARLVPGLSTRDLVIAESGIRAQAVSPDGTLVDDFVFEEAPRQLHILNAPSPAASASLAIAGHLVNRLSL